MALYDTIHTVWYRAILQAPTSVNGRVIGGHRFCLSASLMNCYGVGIRNLGVVWCSS